MVFGCASPLHPLCRVCAPSLSTSESFLEASPCKEGGLGTRCRRRRRRRRRTWRQSGRSGVHMSNLPGCSPTLALADTLTARAVTRRKGCHAFQAAPLLLRLSAGVSPPHARPGELGSRPAGDAGERCTRAAAVPCEGPNLAARGASPSTFKSTGWPRQRLNAAPRQPAHLESSAARRRRLSRPSFCRRATPFRMSSPMTLTLESLVDMFPSFGLTFIRDVGVQVGAGMAPPQPARRTSEHQAVKGAIFLSTPLFCPAVRQQPRTDAGSVAGDADGGRKQRRAACVAASQSAAQSSGARRGGPREGHCCMHCAHAVCRRALRPSRPSPPAAHMWRPPAPFSTSRTSGLPPPCPLPPLSRPCTRCSSRQSAAPSFLAQPSRLVDTCNNIPPTYYRPTCHPTPPRPVDRPRLPWPQSPRYARRVPPAGQGLCGRVARSRGASMEAAGCSSV